MLGQNELYLNAAEMRAAIEYYLNNVIMKIPIEVKAVERLHNIGSEKFRIVIGEPEPKLEFPKALIDTRIPG